MCFRIIKLRSGIVRRLHPRVQSGPRRCVKDLVHYVERACRRIGIFDGEISVNICNGRATLPSIRFSGSPADPDSQNPPLEPTGRPRYPLEIRKLLQHRLNRLLKFCSLRFGKLVFEIRRGRVVRLSVIIDYRPDKDDPDDLGHLFPHAPSSKLWPLATPEELWQDEP